MPISIEINTCSEEQCLANGINQRCLWNITLLLGRRNITCTSYKYTEKQEENKKKNEKTGSDFYYI